MKEFRLDVTLCFGKSLFEGQELAKIERLLRREASPWASDLHIWRGEGYKQRRDIEDFATEVRQVAAERGNLFKHLVRTYGSGSSPRRTGSVELRGADESLIVVLNLDDYRFAPSAGWWLWGNTLSIQLCARRVAGRDAFDFARRIAAFACADLSPWYAHAYLVEEWDAKNISREGGGMMAIGLDISRHLPGLYWLNFFGEPYCTLIGKERLLSAPAHETEKIDTGVLLSLALEPSRWASPEYRATEAKVLAHLGEEYFFRRSDPHRETVAPDFGLAPLPRHPRFT